MYKVDAVSTLCEAVEPGVITRSLLVSLAIDQGPKKEAGRLFLQDGIELDKLKEIRIEFLNILNIDYLWLLKTLVKLSLSYNVIEKIENLDELINLKELNLSFNRIKVMENLNNLSQLEILLLYSNEISVVENIDNLKKLTILNIGKNKIEDWDHIKYLRNFKLLKSLNTWENPCAETNGYLDYLVAFLPQLLYYQYKMISESTRQSAIDKHYRVISNLEEAEAKTQEEAVLQQQLEHKVLMLSAAYVEYLDEDQLFQQMFLADEVGTKLSTINKNIQNEFEKYKNSFTTICHKLYEFGLEEHEKRTEEIRLFKSAVDKGKENTQNESRRIVDEVFEKKTEIFVNMKDVIETLIEDQEATTDTTDITTKARKIFAEFNNLISRAQTQLMAKEITLHDQIEDINKVFCINMTDMINLFLETAREHFSLLQNAEIEYNHVINELILHHSSSIEDEVKISDNLKDLYSDKDTTIAILAASHTKRLQVVNDREKRMINRLSNWFKDYTNQLVVDENKRHRQQILEISHFFEFQRQEFNSIGIPQHLDLTNIDLNTDVTVEI
ncbi:dynein regulatory complex subunit 3-like [Pseudomyrmex gracilis]|uniref:dynein regulatory complex subunit 3-like n=1 Tax=Pseudomyrmex gracilis TaxID=219809 RepID=UPI000994A14B|nr:dynein regulatory complex subunit 3-like [Pseudomyrmex gracilis]